MSESEKIEMYVNTCKICLLAECMKICPLCQFNVGLEEKLQASLAAIDSKIEENKNVQLSCS